MTNVRPRGSRLHLPEPWEIVQWAQAGWATVIQHFRQSHNQWGWGIAVVAILARLLFLDLIPFGSAQVEHLRLSRSIAENALLPAAGAVVEQVQQPAVADYALAIPLLFGRDPRLAAVFQGLCSILAVMALYSLGRRFFSQRVAVIGALLLACNPWAVLLSREIGPTGLLIPLAMLTLWNLIVAIDSASPWAWAVLPVSLTLTVGTSLSAAPLVLAVLALMILYRRRVRWIYLLFGICFALVLCLPYLNMQNLVRLRDVREWLRSWVSAWATPAAALGQLRQVTRWHGGLGLQQLATPSVSDYPSSPLSLLGRLAGLGFVTSLVVMPLTALRRWSAWRNSESAAPYVAVAVWLLLITATGISTISLFTFQSLAALLLPVGLLSMAVTFDALLRWIEGPLVAQRWWLQLVRLILLVAGAALLLWQGYSLLRFYSFVGERDCSQAYGVPYRYWRRTAGLIRREAIGEQVGQVWMLSVSDQPQLVDAEAVLKYLVEPQVDVYAMGADGSDGLLLPAARAGVYLVCDGAPQSEAMLRQLGGEERGRVLWPQEKARMRVLVVDTLTVEELLGKIGNRGLWALDSGQRLLGYDWPPEVRSGDTVAVSTWWTFLDVPSDDQRAPHRVVLQLVTEDGALVARSEGFALQEEDWLPGLLLRQWHTLELPQGLAQGDYYLMVATYRMDDGYLVRWIDDQGHILGEAIPLGPVRVDRGS